MSTSALFPQPSSSSASLSLPPSPFFQSFGDRVRGLIGAAEDKDENIRGGGRIFSFPPPLIPYSLMHIGESGGG